MLGTAKLDAYLALERDMLEMDADGSPEAEELRDLMDPIWHALDEWERNYLNHRLDVDPETLHPIRIPIGQDFYIDPLRETACEPGEVSNRTVGHEFTDWEYVA